MWSIVRLEADAALCENDAGDRIVLSRKQIPPKAAEGDILSKGEMGYSVEETETARRRARAKARIGRFKAQDRRREIAATVSGEAEPISASALAERFGVSRQVVVGDIALLRAEGMPILATPRGYILPASGVAGDAVIFTVASRHNGSQIAEELYAVVDEGGCVLDVTVEHPVYGQIAGQLHIASRRDADRLNEALIQNHAPPLSD
jgi:transcriptional regulator of NAD metabolism